MVLSSPTSMQLSFLLLCIWGSTKSFSSPSCITYFLFHLQRLVFSTFSPPPNVSVTTFRPTKLWFYKRSLLQSLTFSKSRLQLFRPAVPTPLKRTPKQPLHMVSLAWSWSNLSCSTYSNLVPSVLLSHLHLSHLLLSHTFLSSRECLRRFSWSSFRMDGKVKTPLMV
jgi:hypothetical protein